MNVVCLVGKIIAEPELRQTPAGISVCSFPVSVNRSTKDENGYYKTDVIRCTAWRNTAEFVSKYFHKLSMIGINGSIQVNSYTDKDTGKKLNAFDILVNNVYFVESKSASGNGNTAFAPKADEGMPTTFTTGDLDGFQTIATDDGDLPF